LIPPDRAPAEDLAGEPIVWLAMPGGLEVGLRPVHPEDRDLLMEGFAALSEESRYHRFLTPMPRLTDRQARYLTELDQVNHFAWAIGVPDDGSGVRGVGIARYVRDRDDPATAEIAVAITDAYQGLGLGRLLVRALALVASTHGIERLVGTMLGANRPMVRIFEGLGATIKGEGLGLVRAEAALDADRLCDLDADTCAALLAVAARAAHPGELRREPPRDPG
jgi:RimJ/RimL family protein N-acetyltransferase